MDAACSRGRPPGTVAQSTAACGLRDDAMIEITEVRVSIRNDDKLKAFVSITLNDSFVIRGLKIIKGNTGLFVAMPSRKRPDGQHQDLAHPINDATRRYLTEIVMAEYETELSRPASQHPPLSRSESSF